ncbi:MAG: DUF4340 domain-containing protein [Planctomycetaceae bacterium]|nr:MAG: DUF4340 domain-containing protein [Planctomycetaceae bacterium]
MSRGESEPSRPDFLDLEETQVNEGTKTGIFWAAAVAMLAVAIFVSWPAETDSDTQSLIGNPLFPTFTDPLTASSLRIVNFNDEQGELRRFEVAKDESTGVWSLPSRNGYPADAAEQMQNAANALVALKVLDIQTENAEDHSKLGVVEPKAESLEIGDAGVGQLVSVRGDKNQSLANLIIGIPVPGSETKRYVRIPGQDPVYVVNLDSKVFSSRFEDWIEKDLLQLSSIDISDLEIQNYASALEATGGVAVNRSYDAQLSVDGSNTWELRSLVVFDDQQQPQPRPLVEGERLATAKLNSLKNALDDLKIADVAAKPKGMSENLKADKDLVSDNEAVRSLAARGFFPINSGDIISANGELKVSLNDGVQYSLRFGNVQGLSDEPAGEGEDEPVGGANRYLLVTAQLDDAKFPPPALRSIPKTVEELDEMDALERELERAADLEISGDAPMIEAPADAPDAPATESPEAEPAEPVTPEPSPAEPNAPATPEPAEPAEPATPEDPVDAATPETPADETPASEDPASEDPAGDDACGDVPNEDEPAEPAADEPATPAEPATPVDPVDPAEPAATETPADETPAPADEPDAPAAPAETPAAPPAEPTVEETPEEKQERLEAVQEQLTKENQRMLDARKERMDAARRRVRELNNRFAQWYYVIPESTYRNLRISLEDLIEGPDDATAPGPDAASGAPAFNFPGFQN